MNTQIVCRVECPENCNIDLEDLIVGILSSQYKASFWTKPCADIDMSANANVSKSFYLLVKNCGDAKFDPPEQSKTLGIIILKVNAMVATLAYISSKSYKSKE